MNRREFVIGAGALAMAGGKALAQDFRPTGDTLLDAFQNEINEVTPAAYRDYCQNDVGLAAYKPAPDPTLAALRRLDAAFRSVAKAVRETKIGAGERPAVWFVYNMGVIVKSHAKTFSIDLNHRFAEELAGDLDFALITHNHLDHYTRRFYEAMNGRFHKTVVSNFADNYGAHFNKVPGGYTRGAKTFTFGDVTAKTSLSDHNAYLIDFTMPFEIDIGGFRIYHTGDSQNMDKLNPAPAPDLWLVHPYCGMKIAKGVEKFHPKKTVILHINELGHAKNRWRFTWRDGLTAKGWIEQAGGEAVMPLWGDRIV